MPFGHAPLYYASAVLADGRVIVIGGEYINFSAVWSNLCSVYDPVLNSWSSFAPPAGWTQIGDVQCTVMPDGKLFLAALDKRTAMLNPATMTWTAVGTGKLDNNNEEGWTLLPDGTVLTVCCFAPNNAEKFIPWNNQWVTAGTTPATLPDAGSAEIGPGVLMFDGRVFCTGATGHNAIYTPPATPTDPGTWAAAPDFPLNASSQQLDIADGPACLLPNGKVLCATSPGIFNAGLVLFEFNGVSLALAPNVPNAGGDPSYVCNMIMLPNGQLMMTDFSSDVEVYTPSGGPLNAWRPTITTVPANVLPGLGYVISGTQFNGLSQTSFYGDDATNATNYPIVRITNNASGHVFYCRTSNHTSMGVATGGLVVSTNFVVPAATETGASTIQVVANGIPSATTAITVGGTTYTQSISILPTSVTGGSPATGTVTLSTAAPAGGITVNLSSSNAAASVPPTATVTAGNTTTTFPISTANTGYSFINATITESYAAEANHTAVLQVRPGNISQFIAQTIPTTMTAGQTYPVSVQYKNVGTTTWDTLHGYKLQSRNPTDNTTFGSNRLVKTGNLAPGTTGTFKANLVAPTTPGVYNCQWRCIQDSLNFNFGPSSPNVAVNVVLAADAARFIGYSSVPTSIPAGTSFSPTITFRNVGTNTWTTVGGYVLKSRNPYNNTKWGTSSVALAGPIAPGANVSFTPTFTAPITPGTYQFQWSMIHGATLFGDVGANIVITVT
jgi:hypothetical protein